MWSNRKAAREIAFWVACVHIQDKDRPVRWAGAQTFALSTHIALSQSQDFAHICVHRLPEVEFCG